jgi:dolichyl-phosphate-mannose--protein O-mannosyl transferase
MNDATFLFFFLASLGTYWHWKTVPVRRWWWLLLSSITLGLAVAAKWTAIYGVLIIGADQLITWIQQKKIPRPSTIAAMALTYALVPVIYLGSYYQYFLEFGYKWSDFITLQQQMWWYHTKLSATHAYQSRPWQWLLNLRPVWMYVDYNIPNHIRNIYNLGNTIVLWSGLIAVAELLWRVWKKFNASQIFVLLAYLLVWVPWLFSPRIMFFYHYLPAVPFLVIGLAWALDRGLDQKNDSWLYWLSWLVIMGSLVWFIFFYPQVSAWPMPLNLSQEIYYPVPSWK